MGGPGAAAVRWGAMKRGRVLGIVGIVLVVAGMAPEVAKGGQGAGAEVACAPPAQPLRQRQPAALALSRPVRGSDSASGWQPDIGQNLEVPDELR